MTAVLKSLALAGFAALALSLAPAAAREFTDAEKADMAEAVAAFNTAMSESDWAGVMEVVPARVLEKFATDAGATIDELQEQMAQLMEEALGQVSIESFGMDLDATVYGETADGTPYALIPTNTVIDLGDAGRMVADSQTLGMFEDGEWYLVRADDALTITTLKQLYPSYADLVIPQGTMEVVPK